jgi:hypothetical protein
MDLDPNETSSHRSSPAFSYCMLASAGVLALAAAWLLGPEAARSAAVARLTEHGRTMSTAPCRAARVAAVRGDLWSDCAVTNDSANGTAQGLAAAEQAAAWAPFQSQAWLRLARAQARPDRDNRQATEALRLAYYTGPNEVDLIPQRLLVFVQADMLADADIRRLVRHDIRTILTHAPNMKPAISAAYRQASAEGRRFFAAEVEEVDAAFAAQLQSDAPSR